MSIETLRARASQRILAAANEQLDALQNLTYQPAAIIDGVVQPASSLEEIGARAIVCNARIRALGVAKQILDEEFKKIVDPHGDDPKPESGDDNSNDPVY